MLAYSRESHDPRDYIPHREPFLFVDEVLHVDIDKQVIEAARKIPWNEPWTLVHFPGKAIVPGVLILEGMIQTCGILARLLNSRTSSGPSSPLLYGYLAAVTSARFRQSVSPGVRLDYRAALKVKVGLLYRFEAFASMEGKVVAEAEVTLSVEAHT